MGFTTVVATALGFLFVAVAFQVGVVRADPSVSATILFDLGDGTYRWSKITVADPSATNATWGATKAAALSHGIEIESAWFSPFGVAITDLGNRDPPAGFVGLYAWNVSARSWEFTSVGISGLVLRNGDAIALYAAAFDSRTFEGRFPTPTPDHPYPALGFRGDLANRGSSASEAPDTATVLWDRDLEIPPPMGEIGSTPAVAHGRVFVTTLAGLFALDSETGAVIWTNPNAKGFSSPAAFDGTVLVGSSDGRVYRINRTDGAVRWATAVHQPTGFSGITSSPKVWFDLAFVGTFNESGGPGALVALWVGNGTVAWRHSTGSIHFSSPAVSDGTVYVGVMGRYNTTTQITFDPPYGVLALDTGDGREVWFTATGGSVAASPLVAGPNLVVSSKDGSVYFIDRTTGSAVMRVGVDAGVSSPALAGDTVVVGGGAFGGPGRVYSLDIATGAVRWTFTPNGPVQSSVTYADGKVFFATNTANGTVYALNATSGELVWSFRPSPVQFILGSPVVADGTLFAVSDNGHVYAIRDSPVTLPSTRPISAVAIGAGVAVIAAVAVAVVAVLRRQRRRVV